VPTPLKDIFTPIWAGPLSDSTSDARFAGSAMAVL